MDITRLIRLAEMWEIEGNAILKEGGRSWSDTMVREGRTYLELAKQLREEISKCSTEQR